MYRNYTKLATFFVTLSLLLFSFSSFAKEREIKLKKDRVYVVTMTTNKGDIVMQLLNSTPIHRDNFVKLSNAGSYNNTLFHRVIKDFMIQGGDLTSRDRSPEARKKYGDGENDQPYLLKAEISPLIFHYRGALGAARDPNPAKASSSSQFYIVQCPVTEKLRASLEKSVKDGKMTREQADEYIKRGGGTPHLDGNYTVFGYVLKGMDTVDSIANVKCDKRDLPEEDMEILTTKVIQVKKKKLYKYE